MLKCKCYTANVSKKNVTLPCNAIVNSVSSYDWSGQLYVTGSNDGHLFVCDAKVSNNFKVVGHLGNRDNDFSFVKCVCFLSIYFNALCITVHIPYSSVANNVRILQSNVPLCFRTSGG